MVRGGSRQELKGERARAGASKTIADIVYENHTPQRGFGSLPRNEISLSRPIDLLAFTSAVLSLALCILQGRVMCLSDKSVIGKVFYEKGEA